MASDKKATWHGGPYVRDVRQSYLEDQYPTLVRNNRLRASDLVRLQAEVPDFRYRPRISILMAVLDPEREWPERALDSVLAQVYPGWELCVCVDGSTEEHVREVLSAYERLDERIKVEKLAERNVGTTGLLNATLSVATGEFVGLLGHGDEMAPDALFQVAKLLQEHPESDLVYTDMDEVDEKGNRSNPFFKPDWSPDLLLSTNYVSHLSVYRKELLTQAGGFREGFDGCQDYDVVLRITERTDKIHHIPKVLYHRRRTASSGGGGSREGARRALSESLERRGIEGSVEDGLLPESFRVKPGIKDEPKVSIVIPTRDNVSLLTNCIESIERRTTYRNYEILILDNDSADPATLEYLSSTPHRVLPFREEFNYSRINNFGVSRAEGEYVLLLNDDTEVISGEWLEAMLEHAQRPEVGAVGTKLLYADGRIQHAGVVVGVGNAWGPGIASHSHQFYPSDSPGHGGMVAMVCNYSAVTAACMLLRKSVFEEVGGFEERLRVSFNDVDLCLRIREQGYSIVYTPHAELYHHESVSRGYVNYPAEMLYMRERWGEVLDDDPFYNSNFSKGGGDFGLRADLLRPRLLRSRNGQTPEDPESSFKSQFPASREEAQKYVQDQQRSARDSHRTAIAPALATSESGIVPRGLDYKRVGSQQDQRLRELERSTVARNTNKTLAPASARAKEAFQSKAVISPEQLVWIFGSPRTGSTWLSWMMAELENHDRWHEPYVGLLFGSFMYERLGGNRKLISSPAFIMGEPYRRVWLESVKNFIIEGAAARYPNLRDDQYLVIKEPNGSVGAPLLLEAMPESRLIFLIRDPRDVVASRLDAVRKGSWTGQNQHLDSPERLNVATRHFAEEYFKVVSQVQKAYEAHTAEKALVRYEDLRQDTIGTLQTMYDALKIEASEARLEAAVAKYSWEQIPDRDKGSGKFYRKAQPGGWREDLSPEQIKIIEEVTGPILLKFYR